MEMETATVTVTRKPQRDDGGGRLSDRENATGSGATGSSDPMPRRRVDLQRPLTRDQAGDLWRWLLGIDRYNWPRGNEVLGGGFAFFPVETQEAVQTHFRRMSEVNRIVMTVAFTECLRYIMAEVANLMHMGTLLGRRDAGEMVEVELDPEDGDPEQAEDAEDTTGLMQRFMEPKEQTSPASAAARWTANLGRLQKELIGQSEGVRAANIRRIRQALAACEPWSKPEECREQLRALLVTMWDVGWSSPDVIEVDSQPMVAAAATVGAIPVVHGDGEMDQAMGGAMSADEYEAYEQAMLASELARRDGGCDKRRKCCLVEVEASSGSGDRPRTTQSWAFHVPSDGDGVRITLVARMVVEPEAVSTEPAGSVRGRGGDLPDDTAAATCCTATNALDLMEFRDFEEIYRAWKAAELSLVIVNHGMEVAELLQTHEAVAAAGGDTLEALCGGGGCGPGQARREHGDDECYHFAPSGLGYTAAGSDGYLRGDTLLLLAILVVVGLYFSTFSAPLRRTEVDQANCITGDELDVLRPRAESK
eukprot:s7434_g2.t1